MTGRHLVVFLMRAHGHEGRFGVTATRRVGGAVVRNRCKRRLRELYRIHRHELESGALDIVINARSSCGAAPWVELERDFVGSVRRGLEKEERARHQALEAHLE